MSMMAVIIMTRPLQMTDQIMDITITIISQSIVNTMMYMMMMMIIMYTIQKGESIDMRVGSIITTVSLILDATIAIEVQVSSMKKKSLTEVTRAVQMMTITLLKSISISTWSRSIVIGSRRGSTIAI